MGRRPNDWSSVKVSRESYRHLAAVYDRLMQDAPYDRWLNWAEAMWREASVEPDTVVDLACGTGALAPLLVETGRAVIGVDRSTEMLAVAAAKGYKAGGDVQWVEQDMRALLLPRQVDAVVCFCDSLNYLLTETDWQQTFHAVYQALRPGGVFLFDIHSVYKITKVFGNALYAWEEADVYCIWQNRLDEAKNVVDEALTLFVEQEDGRYERFDECHTQRAFPVHQVEQWLGEAGFVVRSVSSNFQTSGGMTETDERLFFSVQKKEKRT